MSACGVEVPDAGNSSSSKPVDTTKAQLNLLNYDGGFRTDWMNAAVERYEKLHANDSYNGKTGIQIQVTPLKTGATADSIKGDKYDIYSIESMDYYSLVNKDVLLDLTDVYTTANPYESGKTIEDKLTTEQKNYYRTDEGKYYGIPNYGGYFGIAYNIDIFESKGFYIKKDADFADTANIGQYFTKASNNRSEGPDGKAGTSDDGLPVTYDEFFYLCRRMLEVGVTPIIWSGQYYEKQLTGLIHSLVTEAEGAEQMTLTYTMDGTATTLGKVENGTFVADTEATKITTANGYELARRKGNYDSLDFLNRLINETHMGKNYYHDKSFTGGFTHTNAQETFLKDGWINNNNQIGMLVDGSWWESEATDVFSSMATTNGPEYAKENRRFGWMPLPKATKDDNGVSLSDSMYSLLFAKANTEDWKKEVIIDFLQFLNTDESLQEFSVITSTVKALNYDMGDNYDKLSTYGKSLYDLKQSASVVYPIAKNSVFVNSQSTFRDGSLGGGLYAALIGTSDRNNPAVAFYEKHDSVEDYYNGLYKALSNKKIWS